MMVDKVIVANYTSDIYGAFIFFWSNKMASSLMLLLQTRHQGQRELCINPASVCPSSSSSPLASIIIFTTVKYLELRDCDISVCESLHCPTIILTQCNMSAFTNKGKKFVHSHSFPIQLIKKLKKRLFRQYTHIKDTHASYNTAKSKLKTKQKTPPKT